MSVNSDFKDLLNLFNAYRVKYLIIGGYAVIKYTEPRYTKDLDLWIRADVKNANAVFQALKEFGAPLASVDMPLSVRITLHFSRFSHYTPRIPNSGAIHEHPRHQ
jgi:hypothetical protein